MARAPASSGELAGAGQALALAASQVEADNDYGVSIRTIVGFGRPAVPEKDTEPRYFVAGANPLNVRLIVPVVPAVADAGALTAMLPADALPSSHDNTLKVAR